MDRPKPVKVLLKDGSTHAIMDWCKNGDLINEHGHLIIVSEISKVLIYGVKK